MPKIKLLRDNASQWRSRQTDLTQKDKFRQKIYNTPNWKKLRALKIADAPLCEICESEGRTVAATEVHHIDSFCNYMAYPSLARQVAYDYTNLISVCAQCHSDLHKGKKQVKQ